MKNSNKKEVIVSPSVSYWRIPLDGIEDDIPNCSDNESCRIVENFLDNHFDIKEEIEIVSKRLKDRLEIIHDLQAKSTELRFKKENIDHTTSLLLVDNREDINKLIELEKLLQI